MERPLSRCHSSGDSQSKLPTPVTYCVPVQLFQTSNTFELRVITAPGKGMAIPLSPSTRLEAAEFVPVKDLKTVRACLSERSDQYSVGRPLQQQQYGLRFVSTDAASEFVVSSNNALSTWCGKNLEPPVFARSVISQCNSVL